LFVGFSTEIFKELGGLYEVDGCNFFFQTFHEPLRIAYHILTQKV